jgi:hypothetical protein
VEGGEGDPLGERALPSNFEVEIVVGVHWAGMVIRGSFSGLPVSASVKKNITTVSARLVCRSPLSTQNQ